MIKLIPFEDKEENYVIMQEWCSHDFVYEWFEQRILSLDEIRSKYKNKLEVGEQDLFFINYNGKNIGFAQIYKYKGNYFTKTYEYDLFIGEKEYLNKGIGTQIVNFIDNYIFDTYKSETIVLRPFKRNIRAVKCYEKCNYHIIDEYEGTDTIGNPEVFLVMIKNKNI